MREDKGDAVDILQKSNIDYGQHECPKRSGRVSPNKSDQQILDGQGPNLLKKGHDGRSLTTRQSTAPLNYCGIRQSINIVIEMRLTRDVKRRLPHYSATPPPQRT